MIVQRIILTPYNWCDDAGLLPSPPRVRVLDDSNADR